MFSAILPFALKILGGAIVIYIIAAFIVSLKKLLPLLAIISSALNIYLILNIIESGKEELTYLVVILLIFSQLCFQGEGFMNARFVENVYRVVNIERKWTSLFEEDDDYIVHIAPKEIGGFFENAIFQGILFGVIYSFLIPNGSFLSYAIPIYVILMSLVDLVVLFGKEFSGLTHWFIQAFVIIISILLSAYVPDLGKKINQKNIYELCEE